MGRIKDRMNILRAKSKLETELQSELDRSLAARELWGEGMVYPVSAYVHYRQGDVKFCLRDATDEVREWDIEDMPGLFMSSKQIMDALRDSDDRRRRSGLGGLSVHLRKPKPQRIP